MFATAPWISGGGRAKQVPPGKLAKDAIHIANFVSSVLLPRERKVVNDKEFQEVCGGVRSPEQEGLTEERTCILALKGPLFSEIQQETVRTLVKSYHKSSVPVISVESKVRWLSVESSSLMAKKFTMRMFAIRNGTQYMSLAVPPTLESTQQFVQSAINVSVLQNDA